MTPAQVLEAAAKRIDEKGLYQGQYNDLGDFKHLERYNKSEVVRMDPQCDATMTIRFVAIIGDAADSDVDAAKEVLRREIGGGSISEWSDESTAEEVAATMRRMASRC